MSLTLYDYITDIDGAKLAAGDLVLFAFSQECLRRGIVEDAQPINGTMKLFLRSTRDPEATLWIDPAGVKKLEPQP
jgi:hypothetical protein